MPSLDSVTFDTTGLAFKGERNGVRACPTSPSLCATSPPPALRQIVKVPQQPHGITYLGSITLPYGSFSFVLKIQCPEYGTTGIRDAVIADELMGQGRINIDESSREMRGWMQDPYDPSLTDGFRRNVSEDAQYDPRFPTHPLSRLRPLLTRLQGTIQLAEELQGHPPFSPP